MSESREPRERERGGETPRAGDAGAGPGQSARERVRIKFCGLVRPQDVETAVALGADFLGFVFVPGSPRGLAVRRAQQLLAGIDTGSARRVGVFRDQPVAFLNEVAERCRLDLVQLHGHEPLDSLGALRVPAIAVIRVPTRSTAGQGGTPDAPAKGRGRGESLPATLARLTDTSVRGVPGIERSSWASSSPASLFGALIDAEDAAGRSGGLGLRAEPRALRRLLDELPETIRVFLSGGLSPENVGALVAEHRLFAVDVASGVEVAPGIKDAARMRAFVEAVEGAT